MIKGEIMIYEKLLPKNGEVFINGGLHEFKITKVLHNFAHILCYYKGKPVMECKIPVDAPLNKAFRTSGTQFKIIKKALID